MRSVQQVAVYLTIPLLVIGFALWSEYSGLDLWLESRFYDAATGTWPYKSLFITSVILHTWGRYFIIACALTNLFAIIASFFSTTLAPYRKHLLYIFIAAMTGPLLVSMLKGLTYIHTPWDLQLFGGDVLYLRIFDTVHAGATIGHAFSGWTFKRGLCLCLYFFCAVCHAQPIPFLWFAYPDRHWPGFRRNPGNQGRTFFEPRPVFYVCHMLVSGIRCCHGVLSP